MNDANGHREHLEHRAAEVRSRLERRLDLIDERRHRLADVARATVRPPASILLFAAVGVAVTLFIAKRVRARRARGNRLTELLAPAKAEKGFIVQGLEKAATSLIAVAVQRLGKRGLDQLLMEAPPRSGSPR